MAVTLAVALLVYASAISVIIYVGVRQHKRSKIRHAELMRILRARHRYMQDELGEQRKET